MITPDDLYLFHEGSQFRLYDKFGAHADVVDGVRGTRFALWAPNARQVALIGDFNGWDSRETPMFRRADDGSVWERFIPQIGPGARYKYHVVSGDESFRCDKADPLGFAMEEPPETASIVWPLDYSWGDAKWIDRRHARGALRAPMSIYEVHLGSWLREGPSGRFLSYREIAPRLVEHIKRLGFTHVELLPVMEHPFYGSWGYQITGYFAPTRRYGVPQDLMFLIDHLHQHDIGVILDWVPGHFPSDAHGLSYFDGTHLFEHADPRQGFHPEWNSLIFNYGRPEVRSFLISAAVFWLDRYHIDGLRIDGVASMLHLDYARKEGEWIPNEKGGNENLDAVLFLRRLNDVVHRDFPDTHTIAEDSTSWPMVTRPTEVGGLGFRMKWDMGWMHDTLRYLAIDPIARKLHHEALTFRSLYQFNENYVLPLSHDEVVHQKKPLVLKMNGDWWKQRANLRLLYGVMWTQPGKKLLFMGGEFAATREWNHDEGLDWGLRSVDDHAGIERFVAALNRLYVAEPSLHACDCDRRGFEWINGSDVDNSVITYLRRGRKRDLLLMVAINFTPIPRHDYWVGVPCPGAWTEILNSDAHEFGGSGVGNHGPIEADDVECLGRPHRVRITLPPLSLVILRASRPPTSPKKPSKTIEVKSPI